MADSNPPQTGADNRVLLGQISAAHGIRGEVTIRTFTAAPDAIAAYGPLTDRDGFRSFIVKVVRVTDKGVVARISGVQDRNGAEALRGTELYVDRAALPQIGDAEFYHADLIGIEAFTADGVAYGRVIAVQNFGAGDLLEIKRPGARESELVPFTNACAPTVDIAARRIVVAPPVIVGDEPHADSADDA